MELSKFTANCTQSAQFARPFQNHVKFTQSTLISQDSLSPLAKLPKFMTFAHFCIFADFAQFTLAGKQPRLERIQ